MGLKLDKVGKTVDGEMHLADIDLHLAPGERYVVLGRTLAGKTSLLRIMAGLDRPTVGTVHANGKDVTGVSVRNRSVAMVYQQFINYPSQTIYNNIASPLKIQGLPKAEIETRVADAARMLHLTTMLDRLPAELSGGQQQRTAIARALVKDADLLLLDEPLVNLDYKLREELRDELRQIFSQRDSVVVYTTTEPSEALMLGGNVIVMHEGRVLQIGPTAEVYMNPATATVAQVFSDPPINFLPGKVDEGCITFGGSLCLEKPQAFAELSPGEYRFGVRSNKLALAHDASEEQGTIEGVVDISEINGSETFVHVHCGESNLVVQESGVRSYEPGSRVHVRVDLDDFYAFGEDGALLASAQHA